MATGQKFSANDISEALNLSGPFGPVTDKLRWPGGQMRWPQANGLVLTTSLHGGTNTKQGLQPNYLTNVPVTFPGDFSKITTD